MSKLANALATFGTKAGRVRKDAQPAAPADAAPSVAMNDRGKASDAPLDDAMKCALMKSVKFIDAAPSVAPTALQLEPVPDPMNYKGMFLDAVQALADIDRLLGLPEDGCNDPQITVSALADYIAGAKETAAYRDQGVDAQYHAAAELAAAPSVAPEPVAWLCLKCGATSSCQGVLRDDNWCSSCASTGSMSPLFDNPPRAPLTEEIESADNLLRHLGLDPERCRTEGGSLNVSRIKTLLADAAPTARESAKEELLRSAAAIAQRHGAGTAWDRFGASIKALGIGAITARTYRLLPSDTERQQPPTTDPSRLADDLSNIGTMSPRIRKLYDDAAAFIRSTQAPLAPWQSMKTAPKDGAAVLVLLDASNIPHAARWLSGPDDRRATEETTRAGWYLTWDGSQIEEHDGPRYWMPCPDDPDESDIEAAHGIGGK